ncbi:MAG: alfa-L-rhamnosidase, partial [Lachnospiraceae bacterium]|nr:alfa-L-rhamnosidase [Lachnospiraceae bacterium]
MRAIRLQVDYLNGPLGLGNPAPRFYWNAEEGVRQTAYQIVCLREDRIIWDSGRVESASMSHIRYEGEELHSRDLVIWRVQLWDENNESGEISESRFEMGLLKESDWKA